MRKIKHRKFLIFFLFFFFFSIQIVQGYKVDPPNTIVHQHITKEAEYIWSLVPFEIKLKLNESTNEAINGRYDAEENDDIITGSGEEDKDFWKSTEKFNRNHFWDPDIPKSIFDSIYYDRGLLDSPPPSWQIESSYTKADKYWRTRVLENYLNGNIDESYYWLGRVAHLLEDGTVPAHMHLDIHYPPLVFGDDSLEEFTGNNFTDWNGSNYTGELYYYEKLNNTENLNWSRIEVTPNDYLFRLFWYTAQKTQYFASDDEDGNDDYKTLDDTTLELPNLWAGESVTIISEKEWLEAADDNDNEGPNLTAVADAVVPHAMEATAGLYRLFWDTVHSYDWPTYHHDNRRTGFTLLRGNINDNNDIQNSSYILDSNPGDAVDRPSVSDIDGNGIMNIIIGTSKWTSPRNGSIYNVEWNQSSKQFSTLWENNIGYPISAAPSLGNIDDDDNKEIVFGLRNRTFVTIDDNGSTKWIITVPERYCNYTADYEDGDLAFSAISDLDHDGDEEIIFPEASGSTSLYNLEARFHILRDNGATYENVSDVYVGDAGAWGAVSIANIDSDDDMEIIIPGFFGLKVYKYYDGNVVLNWSTDDAIIKGAAVIHDIDYDSKYELIYTTGNKSCPGSKTCYDRLYVRDAETGNLESGYPIDLPIFSQLTPAIADIDGDGVNEIIIVGQNDPSTVKGKVYCYEYDTGNVCSGSWPYSDSNNLEPLTAAPNIVDINGDGGYDIIFATRDNRTIILNNDGTEFIDYDYGSELGSSPIVGDITDKGVSEIVIKRAGSSILTLLTGVNEKPILNNISNISGVEFTEIFINTSGEITATDPNNDSLDFYYNPYFNASGYWTPTCEQSGNHSILIEVSDGELSDWQYINIEINHTEANMTSCSFEETYFADKCNSTDGGEDRDNICRSSAFASDCTADSSCNGITADTGNCTSTCQDNSTLLYNDTSKIIIKNSSGHNMSWFGDLGNILLRGTLEENSAHSISANDEGIVRFNGEDVFILDTTNGNLYIDGELAENQGTLNPGSDDFVIKDEAGNPVIYVSKTGYMFIKGTLTENGDP